MPRFLHPATHEEWLQLRKERVTSTEMSAIYGLSPYLSHFELWHTKKGNIEDSFKETERTRWGHLVERAIATAVAETYGVKVRALNAHVVHDDAAMSSSFDFEIIGSSGVSSELADMYEQHGPGILEIKNVDKFIALDQWVQPTKAQAGEAPPHIEVQTQHQLECVNRKWCAIAALVGGNELWVMTRLRDDDVCLALRQAAGEFMDSLVNNQPPKPDYVRDASVISRIFSYAEPGKLVDLRTRADLAPLVEQYQEGSALEKRGKDLKASARSQLIIELDDAEKALLPGGFKVSAGTVAETVVPEHTRKGYRNFRMTGGKK